MIIPTRAVADLIHLVTLGASVIVQNGLVFYQNCCWVI